MKKQINIYDVQDIEELRDIAIDLLESYMEVKEDRDRIRNNLEAEQVPYYKRKNK